MATEWVQKKILVEARTRGCHVITSEIYKEVPELHDFEIGLANFWSMIHSLIHMIPQWGKTWEKNILYI